MHSKQENVDSKLDSMPWQQYVSTNIKLKEYESLINGLTWKQNQ